MVGGDGAVNGVARNVLVDAWEVGIGDDIAVKMDVGREGRPQMAAYLGRIIRMRKRGRNRGWLDYNNPVNLASGREGLGELYFMCVWYKRQLTPLTYKYNHGDRDEVRVDAVICPVNMTYDTDRDVYLMGNEAMRVVNSAVRGNVDLDMEDV